jgi:predicted anti-sigma-YlaC factor YlaD
MAINAVSNALTGSGSADVFTSDSDPQLVGDAIPFAIKMYESLLSQNPRHEGLMLTTGSMFVMYANAFVQSPAELLDPVDFYEERHDALDRAKTLYLRGNEILSRALEQKLPGFGAARLDDGSLAAALGKLKKSDAALLYWTAASGFAAYSIDVFDFALGTAVPKWIAMMERAYELDADFQNGAIDEFFLLYYASTLGANKARAEEHFARAVEKTRGLSAGIFVSYARAVCVPAQDHAGFEEKLQKALAINVNEEPSLRLVNILAQKKARYLLDTAYEYFSFLP